MTSTEETNRVNLNTPKSVETSSKTIPEIIAVSVMGMEINGFNTQFRDVAVVNNNPATIPAQPPTILKTSSFCKCE